MSGNTQAQVTVSITWTAFLDLKMCATYSSNRAHHLHTGCYLARHCLAQYWYQEMFTEFWCGCLSENILYIFRICKEITSTSNDQLYDNDFLLDEDWAGFTPWTCDGTIEFGMQRGPSYYCELLKSLVRQWPRRVYFCSIIILNRPYQRVSNFVTPWPSRVKHIFVQIPHTTQSLKAFLDTVAGPYQAVWWQQEPK
jgi:hypothetical protein